ncbi:MAG: carbamate kinase [Bacteroidales bacterium]|nr:carbamate kinase [Bacteroidales bacterium]
MGKLVMVAFGGNALLRAGQKGTYAEQLANVEDACRCLLPLLEQGCGLVIGHGNGPQVGNALLRHEAGLRDFGLQAMPMDFCGAETQGSIAYLIETAMERVLKRAGLSRPVVSLVTRVEVAADDPAFKAPSKPVGPFYKECPIDPFVADAPRDDNGENGRDDNPDVIPSEAKESVYREDSAGRGWRKVVASPKPLVINNIGLIERLAREGNIVVAVGGGGIPVVGSADGRHGVEAVIDKDLACALAAVRMNADEFYILTDVPKVYVNFKKPGEKALDSVCLDDARKYLAEGQFAEGSMAPKIRAAISFVENGGGECIITEAGQLGNPSCGTRITK